MSARDLRVIRALKLPFTICQTGLLIETTLEESMDQVLPLQYSSMKETRWLGGMAVCGVQKSASTGERISFSVRLRADV